jgi:murein DD-endopeptidase MepM/ murein hydrolase activator NlpD
MKRLTLLTVILLFIFGCNQDEVLGPEEDFEPASSTYRYPLEEYSVTRDFGTPNNDFDQKFHSAEDLHGTPGMAVYAVADGEISYSGTMGVTDG